MEIRNIVILVIFMLGLVYMQYIQAHSVGEIINKYTDAIGGKEKLNSIKSVYMEGSRRMMNSEIALKITKIQDELYRNDFEFGGNKGYIIVTPNKGWFFNPLHLQSAQEIPQERLKTMQQDLDIAGPIVDHAKKGNKVQLIGKEDIDGKETYKIKLTLSTGKDIFYYFEIKTDLLIQTRQMRAGIGENENEESEVITHYSDYLPVDGILFPHTVSNTGSGAGDGFITFKKIELNKPIDKSRYTPFV